MNVFVLTVPALVGCLGGTLFVAWAADDEPALFGVIGTQVAFIAGAAASLFGAAIAWSPGRHSAHRRVMAALLLIVTAEPIGLLALSYAIGNMGYTIVLVQAAGFMVATATSLYRSTTYQLSMPANR